MQNDDEISTSQRGLGILYKNLLAENCQNLKMAATIPMAETKFCIISFDSSNRFNFSLICNSVTQVLQHVSYIHCNAKF